MFIRIFKIKWQCCYVIHDIDIFYNMFVLRKYLYLKLQSDFKYTSHLWTKSHVEHCM